MAGITESFILKMVVDNKQFLAGLNQASSAAAQTGTAVANASAVIKASSDTFFDVTKVRVGMRVINEGLQAAAQLVNVKATAEQVFGDSAKLIEEWAQTSVESFGLSERAFIQGATTIAALGKSAGLAGDDLAEFSKAMVQSATDLAQLYNTSVEDAISAIQSGFSGSSIEPLRRYNIILNDSILKNEYFAVTGERVTGVLTTQQRMVAFISAFQKQSADATGQWAREYDGLLATQQRFSASLENLKATIGESLIAPATTAVQVVTDLMGAFTAVDSATSGFASSLVAVGAAGLVAAPVIRRLENVFLKMRKGSEGAQKGIGALNAVLGVAAIGWAAWEAGQAKVAARQEKLGTMMAKTAGYTEEQVAQFGALMQVWENMGGFDAEGKFREIAEGSTAAATAILQTVAANKDATESWADAGLTLRGMREIIDDVTRSQEQQSSALSDAENILAANAGQVERNEKAWDDYGKAVKEAGDKADDARQKIKDLLDQASTEFTIDFDPMIAVTELLLAQAELRDLQAETGKGETDADNLQNQLDILEKQKEIREDINAIVDASLAQQEDETGVVLEGNDLIQARKDALNNLKIQFPNLAGEIDAALAEIEQQQPSLDVAVKATLPETFEADLQAEIDASGAREVAVDLLIEQGWTEEDARTILDRLPDKVIADVIIDQGAIATKLGLSDKDFAKITVKALTDAAQADIDELTGAEYVAEVLVNPDLAKADSLLSRWRSDQEKKPVTIPVKLAPTSRTNANGNTDETGGPRSVAPTGLLGAEQQETTVTSTGGVRLVRAGMPIVNNTNVYVTLPPGASPTEVVSALQTWQRRNGSIQSVVA